MQISRSRVFLQQLDTIGVGFQSLSSIYNNIERIVSPNAALSHEYEESVDLFWASPVSGSTNYCDWWTSYCPQVRIRSAVALARIMEGREHETFARRDNAGCWRHAPFPRLKSVRLRMPSLRHNVIPA